jgi:undecaprenyl diphosphate synthase
VNLFNQYTCLHDLPAVDLLIRTGGDYRLSNFLIWQSAYAELFFTETLWPDFGVAELDQILQQFVQRERRFGKTSEQVQSLNTMREN